MILFGVSHGNDTRSIRAANACAGNPLEQFRKLEEKWKADTQYLSDPARIIGHPAFQAIIALGDAVVPLLLRDLESQPSLWVWALPDITGENPIAASDQGNIRKMGEAWLQWGREKAIR